MKTQNMKIKKFLKHCDVEKKENYNHKIEELQRRNQLGCSYSLDTEHDKISTTKITKLN